jgi:hypothetical protein
MNGLALAVELLELGMPQTKLHAFSALLRNLQSKVRQALSLWTSQFLVARRSGY